MARASTLPDGVTAPIDSGLSIQDRMKRDFVVRSVAVLPLEKADPPFDLLFKHLEGEQWHGANAVTITARTRTVIGKGRQAGGQAGRRSPSARAIAPALPKKSLTLAKKPADSGWVSLDDSFSNSASSSRCRLVRFCGVSTTT